MIDFLFPSSMGRIPIPKNLNPTYIEEGNHIDEKPLQDQIIGPVF